MMSVNDIMHVLTSGMEVQERVNVKMSCLHTVVHVLNIITLAQGKKIDKPDFEKELDKLTSYTLVAALKQEFKLNSSGIDKLNELGYFDEQEKVSLRSSYEDTKRMHNLFHHNLDELVKKCGL